MDSSTFGELVFCYCFIYKRLAICNFVIINRFVLVLSNLIALWPDGIRKWREFYQVLLNIFIALNSTKQNFGFYFILFFDLFNYKRSPIPLRIANSC